MKLIKSIILDMGPLIGQNDDFYNFFLRTSVYIQIYQKIYIIIYIQTAYTSNFLSLIVDAYASKEFLIINPICLREYYII